MKFFFESKRLSRICPWSEKDRERERRSYAHQSRTIAGSLQRSWLIISKVTFSAFSNLSISHWNSSKLPFKTNEQLQRIVSTWPQTLVGLEYVPIIENCWVKAGDKEITVAYLTKNRWSRWDREKRRVQYFAGPQSPDLTRGDIARLGQIIRRLSWLKPSARPSARQVVGDPWFNKYLAHNAWVFVRNFSPTELALSKSRQSDLGSLMHKQKNSLQSLR